MSQDFAERLEVETALEQQRSVSEDFCRLEDCKKKFLQDVETKTMSWLDTNSGGALVPPPQQGSRVKIKPSPFLHRNKSLFVPHVKGGFTGAYTDASGRRVCFSNGLRVACHSGDFQDAPSPESRSIPGGEGGGGGSSGQEVRRFTRSIPRGYRKLAAAVAIVSGTALLAQKMALTLKRGQTTAKVVGDFFSAKLGMDQLTAEQKANVDSLATFRQNEYKAQLAAKAVAEVPAGQRDYLIRLVGKKIKDEDVAETWSVLQQPDVKPMFPKNKEELTEALRETWRHQDWMKAKKRSNQTDLDFVRENLPALEGISSLDVTGVSEKGSGLIRQNLYELSLLPPEILNEVGGPKGDRPNAFIIGKGNVKDLGDNSKILENTKPKDWPATKGDWEKTGIWYDRSNGLVTIGTQPFDGSVSPAIHATALALGDSRGLFPVSTRVFVRGTPSSPAGTYKTRTEPPSNPDLINHWKRLSGVGTRVVDGTEMRNESILGTNEKMNARAFFGESVARYYRRGKADVVKRYGNEYADWLENQLNG